MRFAAVAVGGVLFASALGGGPADAVSTSARSAPSSPQAAALAALALGSQTGQVAAAKTHANRYWGLPNIVGSDARGFPKALTADQLRGYVRDTATRKRLPGLHLPGVHVRRAGLPKIRKVTLSRSGKDWKLETSATATPAIYGKRPRKALEEIAVVVTVRDTAASSNPSRQPVLYRSVKWRTLQDQKLHSTVSFSFPKSIDRKIARMSAARRGKAITVNVVQVIDADGRIIAGRRTADHLKTAAIDLATARARTSGGGNPGALINYYNNDQTLAPNGTDALALAVNLVGNPVSCMQTTGSNESDFAALNVSGLQPGATTEGFIQHSGGSQQAANQAPAAEDVTDDMAFDYAEAIVETAMGIVLSWTTVAFDAFEALVELWLSGCSNDPGMYTVAATDPLGNSSAIGYALDQKFNDAATYVDYTSKGAPGGIADAASAYDIFSTNDDIGFANKANFLNSAFLQNNYAPGPQNAVFVISPPNTTTTIPAGIMGSGGDSGLSQAGSSGPTVWPLASIGGKEKYDYPVLDFYVNWGSACSSQLGGLWGPVTGGYGVSPNYVYNPCQGWPTVPVPISGAVPNAPTLTAATVATQSITATWTASPTSNPPALAPDSYTVTATGNSGGSGQCTTTSALTCTVTGLPTGQTYSVTVAGINGNGSSAPSNAISAAVAPTVPGPTNITSGSPGNATLTVTWAAPADGGYPITSYTATAGSASCTTTALSCTITGLTNGSAYLVQVTATNQLGTGMAGTGWIGTPGLPPTAPTVTGATPSSSAITVTWDAPFSDGGKSVTSYTASATDSAGNTVAQCGLNLATENYSYPNLCVLQGVPANATYQVSVTATNAMGTGPASAPVSVTMNSNLPDPVTTLNAYPGPPGPHGEPSIVGQWAPLTSAQTSGLSVQQYTMVATNPATGATNSCTFTPTPAEPEPTCQLQGFDDIINLLYVTATTSAGTSAPQPQLAYMQLLPQNS